MSETEKTPPDGDALLDEMTHWTGVIGRAQQLLMEHGAETALKMSDDVVEKLAAIRSRRPMRWRTHPRSSGPKGSISGAS